MKYDFLILGGSGMQGQIVARDLLDNGYSILIADLYREGAEHIVRRFRKRSAFEFVDVRDVPRTVNLIRKSSSKVVINCTEGDWNVHVYKACLEAGVHVIDLGSEIPMTQEQFAMHEQFKEKGLTAITGSGSTPGVNNVMLRYAARFLDSMETVEVGFAWDSNIKQFVVPFSIQSIIEEFTDPAAVIENNEWKYVTPMESIEVRELRTIGKQQCFIVRHPETFTFYDRYKSMGLKNVRFYAGFPDHSVNAIRTLIDLGFGSRHPVRVDGSDVAPIDVTTQVLKHIVPPEGYQEYENLWLKVVGKKDGVDQEIFMECIVPTLPGWEWAGCNVDTGMPVSIMAQMMKEGTIKEHGSFAPEGVVPVEPFFNELFRRGMRIYSNGKMLKPSKTKTETESPTAFAIS